MRQVSGGASSVAASFSACASFFSAGFCTNSTRTASPISAKQKLTKKIEWKPCGSATSMPNAIRGPITAPAVSIARCTPKAVPS